MNLKPAAALGMRTVRLGLGRGGTRRAMAALEAMLGAAGCVLPSYALPRDQGLGAAAAAVVPAAVPARRQLLLGAFGGVAGVEERSGEAVEQEPLPPARLLLLGGDAEVRAWGDANGTPLLLFASSGSDCDAAEAEAWGGTAARELARGEHGLWCLLVVACSNGGGGNGAGGGGAAALVAALGLAERAALGAAVHSQADTWFCCARTTSGCGCIVTDGLSGAPFSSGNGCGGVLRLAGPRADAAALRAFVDGGSSSKL